MFLNISTPSYSLVSRGLKNVIGIGSWCIVTIPFSPFILFLLQSKFPNWISQMLWESSKEKKEMAIRENYTITSATDARSHGMISRWKISKGRQYSPIQRIRFYPTHTHESHWNYLSKWIRSNNVRHESDRRKREACTSSVLNTQRERHQTNLQFQKRKSHRVCIETIELFPGLRMKLN